MITEPLKVVSTRDAMKEAIKSTGVKQYELAERLGIKQASLSGNINRQRVSVDVMVSIMEALGYTLVVGKKEGNIFTPIWELENK